MNNEEKMSTPVTRGDLREELAPLERRFEQSDQRFEQIDRRFEQVDQRFEQIDRRFEQVDQRFEQIDRRFEQVDQRFEQMDQRFEQMDQRFEQMDQRLEQMATKRDLELWGGMLLERFMDELRAQGRQLEADLARHSRANAEDLMKLIAVIDEKYTDLPGRVKRLESKVFPRARR